MLVNGEDVGGNLGVEVSNVEENFLVVCIGLQEGDVILSVGCGCVINVVEFCEIFDGVKGVIVLNVCCGNVLFYVVIC